MKLFLRVKLFCYKNKVKMCQDVIISCVVAKKDSAIWGIQRILSIEKHLEKHLGQRDIWTANHEFVKITLEFQSWKRFCWSRWPSKDLWGISFWQGKDSPYEIVGVLHVVVAPERKSACPLRPMPSLYSYVP